MMGNSILECLRGPLSPMTRVTFGCLYAGPLVSHLYVVVQSTYNVESDSVALLCATGVLVAVYSALLLLWMQIYGITLDCDRGFQHLYNKQQQQQSNGNKKKAEGAALYTVGTSRHCVSVFWIVEALSGVFSQPNRSATTTTTRIINGKRINTTTTTTTPKSPLHQSSSYLLICFKKICAVGMWVGLEVAYHITMLLEHILRLRTVVVTAAQMLFCFHGISAFLFERPEGKFGLSPVDFWLWKVAAVAGCALWHLVSLPTSPQWERGARVVGYIALFAIFIRFSNFSSVASLEWEEDNLMSTATFLPMKQQQQQTTSTSTPPSSSSTTGTMSTHKLSLPFTSSLLISSLVLSLGFDSGRSIVLDPSIVSSSPSSYTTLRRAIWSTTLRAQLLTMMFISVISVLAVTSVNHGYGGHTMLTNVIVKVSNLVRTTSNVSDDNNNSGDSFAFTASSSSSQYISDYVLGQLWSVVAQLTCLIAFTAMIPGLINTCKKQVGLVNLAISRLSALKWRRGDGGDNNDDVADTLVMLTSVPPMVETSTAVVGQASSSSKSAKKKNRKGNKQQPVESAPTNFLPVTIGVAILALLPTFFNNSPYGFAPMESNVGAALPSARAFLRTINTYFSYNWVMLLFVVSILVEFVVPALAGVAFTISASEGTLRSITSSSPSSSLSCEKKNRLFSLRLRQFVVSLVSLVASTILLFLTVLYL